MLEGRVWSECNGCGCCCLMLVVSPDVCQKVEGMKLQTLLKMKALHVFFTYLFLQLNFLSTILMQCSICSAI